MPKRMIAALLSMFVALVAVLFGGGTALAVPVTGDSAIVSVESADTTSAESDAEEESPPDPSETQSEVSADVDDSSSVITELKTLPKKLTYYVAGAGSDGLTPKGFLPDGVDGMKFFVQYPARALDMTHSAEVGAQALIDALRPGADGVCRVGGYSLGTVTIVKALQRIIDSGMCPKLDVVLSGSPNGAGSMATLLPDNFLIVFNQEDLAQFVSDTVSITVVNMRSDGYASCLNQLSSVVSCTAGMFTGHYCAVADKIEGQCYSDFTGEWTETVINGVLYKTAETRNPVGVLYEYAGKVLLGEDFGLSPVADQLFELLFPQGSPGVQQSGVTPREVLQSVSGLLGSGR